MEKIGSATSYARLRDEFAMAALPSIIIATSAGQHTPCMIAGEATIYAAVARDAYKLADAMMGVRK